MARRGPKSKEVNEVLRKNVFKRPEFLDKMPSKGQRGKAIAMLSEKIKNMTTDESVVYSVNDFVDIFTVKDGSLQKTMNYMKTRLKKVHGIKEPRIHHESTCGKIYIWALRR